MRANLVYILVIAKICTCHPVLPNLLENVNSQSNLSEERNSIFIFVWVISALFAVVLSLIAVFLAWRFHRFRTEEEVSRQEDNQAYLDLDSDEQELYFQSKEFLEANPYLRGDTTLSQNLSIQEKGVQAWEFVKDSMLTNNDLLILQKHELTFFKKFECSVQTNLPLPKANDVYYFESKIYSLPKPEETIISIGLGIKPYPWFRLPGRHAHCVSYDSNGYRRHNQPFPFATEPPFPKLIEGDVVGVGYRVRSGTVFFTRNGKKVSERKIGGHIKNFKIQHNGQLFPTIGANNLCSVHVNVGQLGFVFIEGNVKKWGFAPLEGNGPAPPAYNKFNEDVILERSEIDEENDLSDRENDFPPDFWEVHGRDSDTSDKFSYNAYSDSLTDERITMHSLIPTTPPSYEHDTESLLENNVEGGEVVDVENNASRTQLCDENVCSEGETSLTPNRSLDAQSGSGSSLKSTTDLTEEIVSDQTNAQP